MPLSDILNRINLSQPLAAQPASVASDVVVVPQPDYVPNPTQYAETQQNPQMVAYVMGADGKPVLAQTRDRELHTRLFFQRFAVHGLVGGCSSIQFKHGDWKGMCQALQSAGWGVLDALKMMPYINRTSDDQAYLDSKQVTPLSEIVELNLLPAEFRKAIEAKPAPAPTPMVAPNVPSDKPAPAPKKNNTFWIVGAVVAVLVIVGVVYVANK